MLSVMKNFFSRPKTVRPSAKVPAVITNLKTYYSEAPTIFWFGHSSYLIHCRGVNILVDPVLSGHASPFRFYIKAFEGSDIYKAEDMPDIDVLIITHNHYDHLDIHAINKLAPRTKAFYMPLGVGASLSSLKIDPKKIKELDWWQSTDIDRHTKLTATPARHFSGRGLKRNGSLWSSFVLSLHGYTIFIGSDSGYDDHFKEIGKKFGPMDIAILECGQYNEAWRFIHSMPEELVTEAIDLQAKVVLPVHWGKFALALHDWDEPIKRFVAAAHTARINYTTPMIGEPVLLGAVLPKKEWWREVGGEGQ